MDEVLDGRLFVGSVDAAGSEDLLKEAGITHIINAAYGVPCLFPNKFKYLSVPALDRQDFDIMPYIKSCLDFYYEATGEGCCSKVLVHCTAGVSRSGAITVAIIMHSFHLSYDEALSLAKKKRACLQPNPGFTVQLKAWWLNGMKKM